MRPEEDQRMQRCERIGNDHMKKATRDIEEIKERMRILTERIAQEEDTDKKEELEQIVTRLQSALAAAKMAREYMKVSGNAAYEMIGKKPTDKDGKIQKRKKYQCNMCSFNTKDDKILEEHINKYHRPRPIRAVSDASSKNKTCRLCMEQIRLTTNQKNCEKFRCRRRQRQQQLLRLNMSIRKTGKKTVKKM